MYKNVQCNLIPRFSEETSQDFQARLPQFFRIFQSKFSGFFPIDILNKKKKRNIQNLINHDKGNTFLRIKQELENAGYYVNAQVLNSQDFGVPQRRNRVFIVAFNSAYFQPNPFEFPENQE